jgi:cytochrome c biogenesis protein CcdA
MGQLQAGQEVTRGAVPGLSQKKVRAKRRWQVWHSLIPLLAGFWIAFGMILITGGFLFLVVSALAVLAAMSILVIALAWAFQNDI